MKRFVSFLLAVFLVLVLNVGCASTPVEDRGLDLLGSSVHYPYLPEAGKEVNAMLVEASGVGARLDRMSLLAGSTDSLKASYTVMYNDQGIFSCVFAGEGALETSLPTWQWNTVNMDVETCALITLDDLFIDTDHALAFIADYLQNEVAPELSAYLQAWELTPVPESFTMDAAGITFFYPVWQLRCLSDRAGSVQIAWYELRELLDLEEGSILERVGVKDMLGDIDPEGIAAWCEKGTLPSLPVTLGGSMKEATDAYKMLTDNDMIPGARVFNLEAAPFRNVDLITDALTEDWDNSVILSIRSDRMNFCGLITGETTREAWQAALGAPEASVELNWDDAVDYRTVAGVSDYYTVGGHRLRLHADEEGVLVSIYLSE